MIVAALKAALVALWVLFCTTVCAGAGRLNPRYKPWVIRLCYRGLWRIIGIRVRVEGKLTSERPLLMVSNHCSYLDIIVLGGFAPRFTPKAEVAGWPLIGWICRVSDCIFIDRRLHKTPENQEKLRVAAEQGALISLFPEGTTSDGKRVLPFRSSYFSLCGQNFGGKLLTVQPVAIAYTRIRNLPIDSTQRPKIAWYGDMSLLPHLMGVLKLGGLEAKVTFCAPVAAEVTADRKQLAAQCRELINSKINVGL